MCGKLSPPGIYLLRWGGLGKGRGWRGGGCSQAMSWQVEIEETDMNLSWCISLSCYHYSAWCGSDGHLKPGSAESVGEKKEAIQPLDSRHAAWKKKETERQCRRSECNPEGAMLFDLGWVAMKQKITSVALQRKRKTPASWAWLHVQPKIICTDRSDTADLLPLCLPASHFNSCSQWKTWPTLQHQTIDTQVSFCYGRMETCFPLCHS